MMWFWTRNSMVKHLLAIEAKQLIEIRELTEENTKLKLQLKEIKVKHIDAKCVNVRSY